MVSNRQLQLRLRKGSNVKSRNLNPKTLAHKGFTLIELLVVVVILGVLSGIALPGFLNQQKKAVAAANNTEALAQARACAALVVVGDTGAAGAPTGCGATGGTFTVDKDSGKATAAVATVDSNGAASLTTTSAAK